MAKIDGLPLVSAAAISGVGLAILLGAMAQTGLV
jgi:hypothetical protein